MAETTVPKATVRFPCPACLKTDITRTPNERKIGAKYRCSCGFEGPN